MINKVKNQVDHLPLVYPKSLEISHQQHLEKEVTDQQLCQVYKCKKLEPPKNNMDKCIKNKKMVLKK